MQAVVVADLMEPQQAQLVLVMLEQVDLIQLELLVLLIVVAAEVVVAEQMLELTEVLELLFSNIQTLALLHSQAE
jgi:hypothetical protein